MSVHLLLEIVLAALGCLLAGFVSTASFNQTTLNNRQTTITTSFTQGGFVTTGCSYGMSL